MTPEVVSVLLRNARKISVWHLLPGTGPLGASHKRCQTLFSRSILRRSADANLPGVRLLLNRLSGSFALPLWKFAAAGSLS